ncbi:MAG: hypothetical protein LQ342_000251 [Letrouitia transgressa]|nr:MAG: hypothetical protein LQ342_000251 [Letrouitia transgressa]
MVFELVPQTEYAAYTALVSAVFALSLLLGPLLGGAINNHTTWRWVFLLNNTFLVGTSFTVPVIELPLRFQNVYNFSPFKAGLGLLPFAFTTAIGSTVASVAASKSRIPLIYILTAGTALQVIGFVLLSLVPTSEDVYHPQYGFQVIAALGVGANAGILILMTPFIVEKRDQSVAMGATVQFRMMGGAIGLAVVTSVFNSYTQSRLSKILLPDQLDAVLDTSHAIAALDPTLRSAVRTIFAEAYRLQFRILIGTAAAQYLATALMWQRKPLRAA